MTVRAKDTVTNGASTTVRISSSLEVPGPRDVDGGWAWVVLACAVLGRVVQGGLFWSMNFYFVAFHDAFGESRTYTSFVGALAFASYHSSSPLSALAIQKLGVRATVIIGSLLVSCNYLLNFHASGVLYLIITHTLFFGFGFSLISNASLVSLNQYFRRYMFLVTGVSLAGAGVGTFVFALLIPQLFETYGWRGSLFLLAGIALQCCLAGSVLFPVKPVEPPTNSITSRKDARCCGQATTLLTNKVFWYLNLAQFFFTVSVFSLVILFKDFTVVRGLAHSFSWAQAALGVGDIIGRVLSGYVANQPSVNTPVMNSLINAYTASIVLCLLAVHNSTALIIVSLLLGLGTGSQVSLMCIIPVSVFGREQYVTALGYVQTMAGMGALMGAPICSLITDSTGSYTWTLVFISSVNITSAVLLCAVYFIERKPKKKKFVVEIPEMEKWIHIEQDTKKIIS